MSSHRIRDGRFRKSNKKVLITCSFKGVLLRTNIVRKDNLITSFKFVGFYSVTVCVKNR